jgi:hypothetical protein
MSHESPQPNPVHQASQEQVADQLTQQYRDASQARHDHVPFVRPDNTRSERAALMLTRPIMQAIDTVADNRLARTEKNAGEAAKKHYEQHENDYHERALRMDEQKTQFRQRMDFFRTAPPEEIADDAAALGYSRQEQQHIARFSVEKRASREASGKEEAIEALRKVPGTDPALAVLDGKKDKIPEEGWLVTSDIVPGYGGKLEIYRYRKGQLRFSAVSDNREKYGQARVHFRVERGGDRHTILYENPEYPNKDTDPNERQSRSTYGLPFASTDILPLSNGGRLLDEARAMAPEGSKGSISTSMDWEDIDKYASREHKSDFSINRVVPDQEALGPVLAGLGAGMGLEAQDIETLVGSVGSKVEAAA